MNNYQLNNTSVYLGGQCGWDIVLSKDVDEMYVSEFQLTPISQIVPFNKKAHSYSINNNHSDNLKRFYNDIKENFWYDTPSIDKYSKFDPTYISGVSRLKEYSVYDKQFRFLVPLWLENVDDKKLKFKFDFYVVNSDKTRGESIDSNILEFDFKKDKEFHNKFITYFNNWLTYLNIIPNPNRYQTEDNDNKGNDKILNIDLKERTASLDGVFVSTGQRSGEVNVDYITDNLLSIERPNMEADYLLSSLFKTHGVVSSQLFNLCFCFNVDDIIDAFLYRQLKGKYISIDCKVYLGDELLESRNLFTNYEFIPKTTVNPIFIANGFNNNDGPGSINMVTGDIIPSYEVKVKNINQDSDHYVSIDQYKSENNVLDYLLDYNDKKLKNINKLNQHVYHWGYTGMEDKTFNLYDGYRCSYIDYGEKIEVENNIYKGDVYDIIASNNNTIIDFPDKYLKGDNSLTWILPSKILYISENDIFNYSRNFTNYQIPGLIKHDNSYKDIFFTLERSADVWDSNIDKENSDIKILLIYINDPNDNFYNDYVRDINSGHYPLFCYSSSEKIGNDITDKDFMVGHSLTYNYYTIISTRINNFVLDKLIAKIDNITVDAEHIEDKDLLKEYFQKVKSMIQDANQGEYYGFGTDIGVFEDDLLRQTYYKLNSQTTYVYRKSGKLTPLFSNTYENYNYFINPSTNEIFKGDFKVIDSSSELGGTDTKYIPETEWIGGGWDIVLSPEITIVKEKSVHDTDITIKGIILDKLKDYYDLSENDSSYDYDTLIDYLYKLYEYDIKFEYKSLTDIDTLIYNIKLTLK